MNCLIRKVKEEDMNNGLLEVVTEGYIYHYNGRPDIFANPKKIDLKKETERVINNFETLVILKDNNIIGYLSYKIDDKHARVLKVEQLVISEEYRSLGLGKKLMKEIESVAKTTNCKRIELESWAFNDNAMNFYENQGYNRQRIKYEKEI